MSDIHFPHGRPDPSSSVIPMLVVVPQTVFIPDAARILTVPGAMFVGQGAQLAGNRFDRVMVVSHPRFPFEFSKLSEWLREVVLVRLTPPSRKGLTAEGRLLFLNGLFDDITEVLKTR